MKAQYHLIVNNGFYQHLSKNIFKIILSMVFLVVLIKAINSFFNLGFIDNIIWNTGKITMMYASFFLSESFLLGLLPSTFFIVWTVQFNDFFWMLSILGVISWLGSIMAFQLGKWIMKRKFIFTGVEKRIHKNAHLVNRWGSWIIITAALLPLPYSPVSVASGMVNFSLKNFCYLGTTRILRFYIYGYLIYYFI